MKTGLTIVPGSLLIFFLFILQFIACQKGVNVDLGNATPTPVNIPVRKDSINADYTFNGSTGNCSVINISGLYTEQTKLVDSDFIEISVNVLKKGYWKLFTGIINGFEFADSGLFNNNGNQTIILHATGTPIIPGVFTFPLANNKGNCNFAIKVDSLQSVGPQVNAGPDQIVTLPIDVATLTGSATDAVGTIISYQWRKVSGPMNYFMVAPDNKQTEITSMIAGTYQFELKVSDNRGFSGKDTVALFVHKPM